MAKVEMLKLLIAKVCRMSASQLFPSYSYAVANTGPALPFLSRTIVRCSPAASAHISICICIAIPTLSVDTCTSAAKNCALWEEVGGTQAPICKSGVHSNSDAGSPHLCPCYSHFPALSVHPIEHLPLHPCMQGWPGVT